MRIFTSSESQERSLRRLGARDALGWQFQVNFAFAMLLGTYLFEVARYQTSAASWIAVWLISTAIFLMALWPIRLLWLNVAYRRAELTDDWLPAAIANIAAITLLSILRSEVTGWLGWINGLADEFEWELRILSGAISGIALFVLIGLPSAAYREHRDAVRAALERRDELLGLRESAAEIISDQQEALLNQTKSILEPQLTELSNLLARTDGVKHGRSELLASLRETIELRVRPLSRQVLDSARMLAKRPEKSRPKYRTLVPPPKAFQVSRAIKPGLSFIVLGPALGNWLYVVAGEPSYAIAIAVGTLQWLTLWFLKSLSPANQVSRSSFGVVLLILIGGVSALPGATALHALLPEVNLAGPIARYILDSVIVVLLLGYTSALDTEQAKIRKQLDAYNAELEVEVALFQQEVWLARRNWSYLLHGKVQAALTAALTRLATQQDDQTTLKEIRLDLERARQALLEVPSREVDLSRNLAELVATWQGICDVQWKISPAAEANLASNTNARMCGSEIVREAVSNAVRHGKSSQVQISIDMDSDLSHLEISVRNDGKKLPVEKPNSGLGSDMFSELCSSWDLRALPLGETELFARIPLRLNEPEPRPSLLRVDN